MQIMAGEILLLMVFLDKAWFGPVGKVLDERDATLRSQLSSVKEGSEELDKLTSEAEALIKAARAEVRCHLHGWLASSRDEVGVGQSVQGAQRLHAALWQQPCPKVAQPMEHI